MTRRRSPLVLAVAVPVLLAGCTLGELVPGSAPDGWSSLEPCEESEPWVWVPDFPVEEIESAGLEAECGGTYFEPDLSTYTSIADTSVSDHQLADLAERLEDGGYELTGDTFEPVVPGDEPGLVGSWQYVLHDEDPDRRIAIYIVNFWAGTQPVTYQTFVDVESPHTRALTR